MQRTTCTGSRKTYAPDEKFAAALPAIPGGCTRLLVHIDTSGHPRRERIRAEADGACLLVLLDVDIRRGRNGGMHGAECADVGADGGVGVRRNRYRLGDPLA